MSNIMRLVVSNYNELTEVKREIMLDSWPMMGSPGPMLCIVGTYLAFVLKVGPKMMEKRPAMQLNPLLIAYNAFVVLFSLWLSVMVLNQDYFLLAFIFIKLYVIAQSTTTEPWCEIYACPIEMQQCESGSQRYIDTNRKSIILFLFCVKQFAKLGWWYFVGKIIELLDTVFFVLRKKQNQVTFLHVYHHTMTSVFSWCYLKFLPDEQGAMIAFLNSIVHIVMYTYYLIAALGPNYRKYLWWKKYMTAMQLTQFALMLGYLLMILAMDCKLPRAITYFFMANVVIFIYLFSDFYRKAYSKKEV
nr:PREDICTED: elongation of very long chain fatty acids protein 7-like [Megachile rotundata]